MTLWVTVTSVLLTPGGTDPAAGQTQGDTRGSRKRQWSQKERIAAKKAAQARDRADSDEDDAQHPVMGTAFKVRPDLTCWLLYEYLRSLTRKNMCQTHQDWCKMRCWKHWKDQTGVKKSSNFIGFSYTVRKSFAEALAPVAQWMAGWLSVLLRIRCPQAAHTACFAIDKISRTTIQRATVRRVAVRAGINAHDLSFATSLKQFGAEMSSRGRLSRN